MDATKIVFIVLIGVGLMLFLFALKKMKLLFGMIFLIEKTKRDWLRKRLMLNICLTVFFAIGYCTTIASMIFDFHLIEEGFVSVVFLFGAYYVLSVTTTQTTLVKEITESVSTLVPICSYCKRIRKEGEDPQKQNSWYSVDYYLSQSCKMKFSHSICPSCMEKHFPDKED